MGQTICSGVSCTEVFSYEQIKVKSQAYWVPLKLQFNYILVRTGFHMVLYFPCGSLDTYLDVCLNSDGGNSIQQKSSFGRLGASVALGLPPYFPVRM